MDSNRNQNTFRRDKRFGCGFWLTHVMSLADGCIILSQYGSKTVTQPMIYK